MNFLNELVQVTKGSRKVQNTRTGSGAQETKGMRTIAPLAFYEPNAITKKVSRVYPNAISCVSVLFKLFTFQMP